MCTKHQKLAVGIIFVSVMSLGCEGQAQNLTTLDDLSDGAATVSFFVTLRFGEEQIIAQNGALELRARCILGSGTAGDSLQLGGQEYAGRLAGDQRRQEHHDLEPGRG
jgi:hypothetical protein